MGSPEGLDGNYAEFWGLQDTISILLGDEAQRIAPADTVISSKDPKRRGSRRAKPSNSTPNVKPEQLKIEIELEEKKSDGSNS
jgi:hypothetical protein